MPKENRNFRESVFLGVKLFLILVLLKGFCLGLSLFLDFNDIFKKPTNFTEAGLRNYNPFLRILMLAIIGPIIEELTYRFGLIYSKRSLSISVIGISYFVLKNATELERILCVAIACTLGLLSYFGLNSKRNDSFSKFWKNNRIRVFYVLLLMFGLSHLANYELTTELLIFSPIVVLPHLVGGFIYSYARLSSGIFLAICIHGCNNGILPLIELVIK